MSLERFDDLRRRLLVMGAVGTVPLIAVKQLRTGGSAWDTAWVALCVATLTWVAYRRSDPSRWKVLVPLALLVGLAPVAPMLNGMDVVEISTLALVPIVISVLFLDSMDLVITTCLTGWIANTATLAALGWSAADVITSSGAQGIVMFVICMASAGAEKLREQDHLVETQHSQALRLSESRRAQAERLAIVGRLASGVAHEINNPLAFVKANVNALKRTVTHEEDPLSDEELSELIADTTHGIDRICQIVADLKGFAREDSGLIEPLDVHEAVTGAVRLAHVRLPREAKVDVQIPPDLPMVRASQRKLAQVLLNLLVNAGDALEEMRVPKPTVTIRAAREGDSVTVCITDNGPGIAPAAMARLFEPFFTTKPPGKGTGLGLALSREYVEAFGGTLSAQNVEPRGAEFCITMRVANASSMTPVPLGPSANEPTLRRKAS